MLSKIDSKPEDIDDALEIVNNIQEAARETIGNRRKKKLPWISDEILAMTDHRREIKAKLNKNPSLKPKYRQLTRNIRAGLTRCQHGWTERQCIELETANAQKDMKKLYGKVKEIQVNLL